MPTRAVRAIARTNGPTGAEEQPTVAAPSIREADAAGTAMAAGSIGVAVWGAVPSSIAEMAAATILDTIV
jgi:hypothetical protein